MVVCECVCVCVSVCGGDVKSTEGESARRCRRERKERARLESINPIARHMCKYVCVFCCSSGLWLVNLQVTGSFNAWHTARE